MANLVIKNKNNNNSSLTFDINSGTDWQIKDDDGTLKIGTLESNDLKDKLTIHSNNALSMNRKADTTIGNYSYAEGYNTTASGSRSHAEGYNTTASGEVSHAEGSWTIASGLISHAEGYNTKAEGQYSHAEGNSIIASGNYSHAEGSWTIASGAVSHAEGYKTEAEGQCSHAEGSNTKAEGFDSHAEGSNTKAEGQDSHAEGYNTTASGMASHAEGKNNEATNNFAHAEGSYNIASGNSSHAEGFTTEASGMYSHAEGEVALAKGIGSHAEGFETIAKGNYSHAEGTTTEASGDYSHSEGKGTVAEGEYQHVQGKYNIEDTEDKYVHIVGNGEDSDNRSNAHTIDWDGNAWFAGSVFVGGTGQDDTNTKQLAATDELATKLNINQGVDKAGNHLIVNDNGDIEAYEIPTFDLVSIGLPTAMLDEGFERFSSSDEAYKTQLAEIMESLQKGDVKFKVSATLDANEGASDLYLIAKYPKEETVLEYAYTGVFVSKITLEDGEAEWTTVRWYLSFNTFWGIFVEFVTLPIDHTHKLEDITDLRTLDAMNLTTDQTANGVKTFADGINIGNASLTYDSENKRLVISVS